MAKASTQQPASASTDRAIWSSLIHRQTEQVCAEVARMGTIGRRAVASTSGGGGPICLEGD